MRTVSILIALSLPVGPCKSVERVEVYPEGTPWRVATWSRGRLDGPWRELFPDGAVAATGRFRAGLRQGEWLWTWPDGTPRARRTYREGLQDGPDLEWHENGQVRVEGRWTSGDRDGVWEHHDPDGRLVARETWRAGTRVSIERF